MDCAGQPDLDGGDRNLPAIFRHWHSRTAHSSANPCGLILAIGSATLAIVTRRVGGLVSFGRPAERVNRLDGALRAIDQYEDDPLAAK